VLGLAPGAMPAAAAGSCIFCLPKDSSITASTVGTDAAMPDPAGLPASVENLILKCLHKVIPSGIFQKSPGPDIQGQKDCLINGHIQYIFRICSHPLLLFLEVMAHIFFVERNLVRHLKTV
jgi:hypothetical protein